MLGRSSSGASHSRVVSEYGEAIQYDITVEQGANYTKAWTYCEADGITPVDLTGWSARMSLREGYADDGNAVVLALTSSPAAGITITAASGLITIRMTATETQALTSDKLRYDLELVDPSGQVDRLFEGRVILKREVTR